MFIIVIIQEKNNADKNDLEESVNPSMVKELGEMGIFGLQAPTEFGTCAFHVFLLLGLSSSSRIHFLLAPLTRRISIHYEFRDPAT